MAVGSRTRATIETAGTLLGGVLGGMVFLVRLAVSAFSARATRAENLRLLRNGQSAGPDEPPAVAGGPSQGGRAPRILIVAGEPSGDLHAADLATALRRLAPDARIEGLGGPRMAAAGVDLIEDLVGDPVMGLLPVLARLPYFVRLYRRLLIRLSDDPPDVVVGVDYPGLNLRLARAARRRGVPFVQYVAPQVWAWAPWRARRLAKDVDRVLTILPFEAPIFRAAGVAVAYVGHPLVEHVLARSCDPEYRASLRTPDGPLVALLPGSRMKEVSKNLPLLLAAAERVVAHRADARFVVVVAADRFRQVVDDALACVPALAITIAPPEHGDDAMAAADAAITVSGTATLHLVAHGTPPVVIYHARRAGLWLAQAVVVSPFMALPNLVAGEEIVPEMLALDGDGQRIANALLGLMPGGPSRAHVEATLADVRARLHVRGVPERAAAWVLATCRTRAESPAPG